MDLHLKRSLEKAINSVCSLKYVYSSDVQSRRIEGQFGGELLKKAFDGVNVYIQYTPTVLSYEILEDIITQCYFICKRINTVVPVNMRCYLFNNIVNGISPINKDIFFRQNIEQETFLKAIEEFQVSEDIRTFNQLSKFRNISENTLCIFITDELGCEISEIIEMQYKNINKQSVWIKLDRKSIDVKKGSPTLK